MISAIFALLLEAALRGLLAAAAMWAGLRVLRIGNVVAQKAAWGLVLVAALAMALAPRWQGRPIFAALRLPTLHWDQTPVAEAAGPRAVTPASAQVVAEPAAQIFQSPAISSEEFTAHARSAPEAAMDRSASVAVPQPEAAKAGPAPPRVAEIAWVLYLGVFAALLLRLLFGLAAALRLWMTAKPVAALDDSDGADWIGLRFSARVGSPVNIGSGIVLPADYAEWGEEKLRVVLAHERSHIRQGDFYLQLLAGLYASLFWFSPLGWWLKRKLCELGEAISDRAGLEEAASRSSYAQLLLEFAALPRPTLTGVAMARTSHLAQRIEMLLNESSFRHAFAAGGRRALLAVLLVPVALIAATALVRVEAAAAPTPQAAQQAPTTGQSTPEQVTEPSPAPAPDAVPAPAPPVPSPAAMPSPPPPGPGDAGPAPMPPIPATGAVPPMPPMPPIDVRINPGDIRARIDPEMRAEIAAAREEARQFRGMNFSDDGEPYAVVGDPGSKPRFNGDWDGNRAEEIEKARKVAHGHFLWFRHDGKSYVVDDPAIVSQLEAMNKSTDELHEHMQAIGDQMRALGEQQRDLGKQMRDISVPTPRPLQRNGRVECSRRQPEGQAGRHHQSKRARRTAARIRQNPGRARRAARQDRRPARRSWRQYGKVRRSDGRTRQSDG
jgi:beta-lactamase regulating signal transducer with metallopeptidase domain